MKNGDAFRLAMAVVTIGVCLLVSGLWQSHRTTGQWLGYPLEDQVLVAICVGGFTLISGLLLLAAFAVLWTAERTGLRAVLERPVVPEKHPVAVIGRGVLAVDWFGAILQALLLGAALVVVAVQDWLVAAILGATATTMIFIYLAVHRYAKNVRR